MVVKPARLDSWNQTHKKKNTTPWQKKTTTRAITTTSTQYLPEDVIVDIQRRLAAHSISRLRCVSKSWNSFLSKLLYSSLFYGENNDEDERILITYKPPPRPGQKYVYNCLSYDSLFPLCPARDLPRISDEESRWTLETCCCEGGLICLMYVENRLGFCIPLRIVLFNPVTRETKMLPPLPQNSPNVSIGFALVGKENEEEEDDRYRYKVVFSSDDDSRKWRRLRGLDASVEMQGDEIPRYVCTRKKKCYWIAEKYAVETDTSKLFNLVSFDPSTDTFDVGGSNLPFSYNDEQSVYMVKDETTLAVFDPTTVEVWDFGVVEESWSRLFTIEITGGSPGRGLRSLGLSKHGKVICTDDDRKVVRISDVVTGENSTLRFEAVLDGYSVTHLVAYVPSNKTL